MFWLVGGCICCVIYFFFFFSSRRRHTRLQGDWSSDVCSSDLTRSQAHVDNFWRAIEEKGRGSTGPAGRHRSELRLTTKTEFDHGRHGPGCATSKALPRNHGSSENQRGRPSNAAGPFGRL